MKDVVLYGPDGRPIDRTELLMEQGAAQLTGVRTIWNTFLAPGLTPGRLGEILRLAVEGDPYAYLTLAEEMEERDLHYASVLGTRKRAVSGIPIEIVEPKGADANEKKITDFVREVFELPNIAGVVSDMLDALGKGFSATEIVWDKSGAQWFPEKYEHRDARFFRFDLVTRQQLRLLDDEDPAFGVALKPYKWVVHYPKLKTGIPIRGGLARLAASAFLIKSFTLKDWLAFAEVFGFPIRLGMFNPGASQEDIQTLLRAVANIGSDAAAVIPASMKILFEKGVEGDGVFFEHLAVYFDKQVSKGVLGQTMTTDEGSSRSQGEVHQNTQLDITIDDAAKVGGTLSDSLVRYLVDLNFGPQRRYPRGCLHVKKPEDIKTLGEILPALVDRKLKIGQQSIRQKLGLPEPAEGEDLLEPAGKGEPAAAAPTPPELNTRDVTPEDEDDELDLIRNEALGDWRPMMEPLESQLVELAARSTSYEELRQGLDEMKLHANTRAFVERLALAMFKAGTLGAEE